MGAKRLRCTLELPDGPSRRVGPGGVILGRQPDCDIVATDPGASRRHALVRVTSEGAEVVPIGRQPVELNGTPYDRPHALADGDTLTIPGLVLHISVVEESAADEAGGFVLARARGGSFGIAHTPFVVGGGDRDDLIIEDWPAATLAFHIVDDQLFVEPNAPGVTHDDEPLEVGVLAAVAVGTHVTCRGETLECRAAADRSATTVTAGELDFPSAVTIEMLPRGGLVVFTLATGDHSVYLADRRFDLLMALLQPGGGHAPGEFVSDDVVRAVVWPRNPGVSRPEINVLISRCRRDLVEAGLNGPRLIQRAPGGGGTRFSLARGARIVVKG